MDVHSGWAESGFRSKPAVPAAHARFEPRTEIGALSRVFLLTRAPARLSCLCVKRL